MNGQEMTSIIITAVVGFIFGIWVYFSGFLSLNEPDIPTQDDSDFVLVSEVYGSCEDTCPSFQVLANGSYRYLYTKAMDEERVIREGSLPRGLRRELLSAVNQRTLEAQSIEIEPSICNSFTDGIDVIYRIDFEGERYELNTCGTAINTDSPLWRALVKIWNYFETGQY